MYVIFNTSNGVLCRSKKGVTVQQWNLRRYWQQSPLSLPRRIYWKLLHDRDQRMRFGTVPEWCHLPRFGGELQLPVSGWFPGSELRAECGRLQTKSLSERRYLPRFSERIQLLVSTGYAKFRLRIGSLVIVNGCNAKFACCRYIGNNL